jgi:hypothetical protein
MTGEQLYSIYVQASRDQNCLVDTWASLDNDEKDLWDGMASMVVAHVRMEDE